MLTIAFPQEDTFLARVPFDCGVDERLKVMDQVLEDPRLILRVTNDLARSAPQALWNGRPSTPVVVTLRGAVVRRLLKWSYRTLEDELRGSARWRWFCRVFSQPVPDHSTLRERECLIRPRTLQWLNDRLVALAGSQYDRCGLRV
ncbi:MAG: transposase [Chloroflexi bacterium]|nr:transposase [Chloroflexota bacterium]